MFYCHGLTHLADFIVLIFSCQQKAAEAETDPRTLTSEGRSSSPQYEVGTSPWGRCTLESKPLPSLPSLASRVNHEPTDLCITRGPPTEPLTYRGELLPLDILGDGRVELPSIALVEAIDFSFLFDFHIFIHQNELSNGLGKGRRRTGDEPLPPGPGCAAPGVLRLGAQGASPSPGTPCPRPATPGIVNRAGAESVGEKETGGEKRLLQMPGIETLDWAFKWFQ